MSSDPIRDALTAFAADPNQAQGDLRKAVATALGILDAGAIALAARMDAVEARLTNLETPPAG